MHRVSERVALCVMIMLLCVMSVVRYRGRVL